MSCGMSYGMSYGMSCGMSRQTANRKKQTPKADTISDKTNATTELEVNQTI